MATLVVRYGTHFNIRLGEWLAATFLVSLAALFFGAPTMFNQSPKYFVGLNAFGSQVLWGCGLLFTGAVRIVALWINGRKRVTPAIRMALAFFSCFVWWQITISLLASGVPGLGWAIFPWLLALDMYNVFRSSADAREVFDQKRAENNGHEKFI